MPRVRVLGGDLQVAVDVLRGEVARIDAINPLSKGIDAMKASSLVLGGRGEDATAERVEMEDLGGTVGAIGTVTKVTNEAATRTAKTRALLARAAEAAAFIDAGGMGGGMRRDMPPSTTSTHL